MNDSRARISREDNYRKDNRVSAGHRSFEYFSTNFTDIEFYISVLKGCANNLFRHRYFLRSFDL